MATISTFDIYIMFQRESLKDRMKAVCELQKHFHFPKDITEDDLYPDGINIYFVCNKNIESAEKLLKTICEKHDIRIKSMYKTSKTF